MIKKYATIEITGDITLLSGMHIGTGGEYAAIGAIDSVTDKDPVSGLPRLPGSSLKGKLRSIMRMTRIRETGLSDNERKDHPDVLRIFEGSNDVKVFFRDSIIKNADELYDRGLVKLTETKYENCLNPLTGEAKPRQIERVVRGAVFPIRIEIRVTDHDQIVPVVKDLLNVLDLLQHDYIGGNGSRGYGQVKVSGLEYDVVSGDVDKAVTDAVDALF